MIKKIKTEDYFKDPKPTLQGSGWDHKKYLRRLKNWNNRRQKAARTEDIKGVAAMKLIEAKKLQREQQLKAQQKIEDDKYKQTKLL